MPVAAMLICPIQTGWLGLAFPSLVINYFGQGALLPAHPENFENPFYLHYPVWALLPTVVLASTATSIASQAIITGAFSLTHQAIQLSFLPRIEIRRTSEIEKGQIYIPRVNWLLLAAVIVLVVAFKSSSAACCRLWHCSDGHDGCRGHPRHCRVVEVLELAAGVEAREQPVLSAEGQRSDCPLDQVFVDRQPPVSDVARQRLPS